MLCHDIFALFNWVHIVCRQNNDMGVDQLSLVPRGS